MSKTGDALEALFNVLSAKAAEVDAVIPPPLQNEALPARLVDVPNGLEQHLNIWDSGDGESDELLGADTIADGFEVIWSATVDYVVAGGDRAKRRAKFEAGLEAIWDAIAADRTLGVNGLRADMLTPKRTGSGLITDGMPNILAAQITINLTFVSSKSF